ncbi:male sterility protein-domain-containing protein [Mycena epipterygia]|nr:male sterility protein-domain-containing protein [Mycena epipterygia]
MQSTPNPSTFFPRQTIFLTGGTGNLGGCLLFKLALKVDTRKIYVLVRGSAAKALSQWAETMPTQIDRIMATKKVQLVVGDVKKRHCGLDPAVLAEMTNTVTLVIHSAGNISLQESLKESVHDNCLPTLELAKLAARFTKISGFVYVSTAYVNSFLPDGVVEEKIYEAGDAETQLSEILATGCVSKGVPHSLWPYAFGKHLTERLLLSRNPDLPLLIVRPTIIAPAISQPYPYYGPSGSCPMSTYTRTYMETPDSGVFHVSPARPPGSNVLDEIPVDLVANLILLHAMHGTTGIVHAGAQSYVPRSLSQLHSDIQAHIPRPRGLPAASFSYVVDTRIEQGRYARFWAAMARDWHFSNAASSSFSALKGPLSIALEDHDATEFMANRAKRIAAEIARRGAKL